MRKLASAVSESGEKLLGRVSKKRFKSCGSFNKLQLLSILGAAHIPPSLFEVNNKLIHRHRDCEKGPTRSIKGRAHVIYALEGNTGVRVTRVRIAQIKDLIMIRKLKSGKYRLYSRKVDSKTGKRKNLGTFDTRAAAEKHERAVQYFKHGG